MEFLSKHSTVNNSLLKIIFTVLFIALPFLGFFLGVNYQASVTESQEVPATLVRRPTPTPKQGIDETADWETYNIGQYLFSLPSSMIQSQDQTSDIATSFKSDTFSDLSIRIILQGAGYGIECSNKIKTVKKPSLGTNIDVDTYQGIDGTKQAAICTSTNGSDNFVYLAHLDDKDILVMEFKNSVFNENKADQLFDQILSTFKFLDEKSSMLISIKGVIRYSGLSEEEKQTLDLQKSDFQVVLPCAKSGEICGYFLDDNNITKENLLGKYVEVKGSLKQGWENVQKEKFTYKNQFTYSRLALVPTSVTPLNQSVEGSEITSRPYPTGVKKIVLEGILNYTNRPAPDISEDYKIVLSEPYYDEINAFGNLNITSLAVSPYDQSMSLKFDQYINKKVQVEGTMEWGYSESRYLLVYKIFLK